MSRDEMVSMLENVLYMIETVGAQGEANWNALLASKQQIRKVVLSMKEEKTRDDQDKRG